MFKRLCSALIAVSLTFAATPQMSVMTTSVYAFNNYQITANQDTTVRKEASQDAKIVKKLKKGEKLTVTGETTNKWGNLWYKVSGGYVYSGNFTKVSTSNEKKVITKNVNFNVYALVDTTVRKEYYETATVVRNVKKNEVMSVTQEISNKWGNLWYKVRDGYIYSGKVAKTDKPTLEPQYTPPQSSTTLTVVPKEQERVENQTNSTVNKVDPSKENNKINQNTHSHNYQKVGYNKEHPHYAKYECVCGSGYSSNTETTKDNTCSICTDPCVNGHNYVVSGYEKSHPHYTMYQCTRCDSGYCSDETNKINSCYECVPQVCKDENDAHVCVYNKDGGRLKEHPHYKIMVCSCGKEKVDKTDTGYDEDCNLCNNKFNLSDVTYSDFYGRLIDLGNGRLVSLTSAQQDAIEEFAADYHYSLDLFGMIPVVGNFFDLANGASYLIEGRYAEALLSGAALIPYVGILSTEGKVVAKSGTLVLDGAEEGLESLAIVSVKKGAIKGEENLSKAAYEALKAADAIPESLWVSLKKIYESRDLYISECFYGNKLLITKAYKGSVTSYAGIVYEPEGIEGNRIVHIMQHASDSKAKGKSLFNETGNRLFSMIDDVFLNGDLVKIEDKIEYGELRTVYTLDAGYTIGKKGEHYMNVVMKDDKIVTAYPVKKVGD